MPAALFVSRFRCDMTERQEQIFRRVVLGEAVQSIATALNLKPQTVRCHLSAVYREIGLKSQAELVGWAVAHGVVTVPELQRIYCETESRRTNGRCNGEVGQGAKR